jgi:hypothetical protein
LEKKRLMDQKRRALRECGPGRNGGWLRVLPALLCLLLPACGYTTRSLIRTDIQTVYVPVFDNQTFYRGLEVSLTRSVVEEVSLHTRLRFAARLDSDSTLEGELVAYDENPRAKDTEDNILLKSIVATVRFRWVDNLTGREIVPWTTVREPVLRAVAIGEAPEDLVFAEVAQRIVEHMEEHW